MAKKKVAPVVEEVEPTKTVDQKLLAIAETLEMVVSCQYGKEYMMAAVRNLIIGLKG